MIAPFYKLCWWSIKIIVGCSFSIFLLVINQNNFWQKSTKATFVSGKSKWLNKKAETFLRLFLAINWDDSSFLWLLLAINRDDCSYFFELKKLTPDYDPGPTVAFQWKNTLRYLFEKKFNAFNLWCTPSGVKKKSINFYF